MQSFMDVVDYRFPRKSNRGCYDARGEAFLAPPCPNAFKGIRPGVTFPQDRLHGIDKVEVAISRDFLYAPEWIGKRHFKVSPYVQLVETSKLVLVIFQHEFFDRERSLETQVLAVLKEMYLRNFFFVPKTYINIEEKVRTRVGFPFLDLTVEQGWELLRKHFQLHLVEIFFDFGKISEKNFIFLQKFGGRLHRDPDLGPIQYSNLKNEAFCFYSTDGRPPKLKGQYGRYFVSATKLYNKRVSPSGNPAVHEANPFRFEFAIKAKAFLSRDLKLLDYPETEVIKILEKEIQGLMVNKTTKEQKGISWSALRRMEELPEELKRILRLEPRMRNRLTAKDRSLRFR